MKPARIFMIMLFSLFVFGCASSALRVVETGFTAVETSPSRFVVKLESDEIRTAEEAEANLLVHSARWTIDHSGVYFILSDRIEGSESEINLDQESREDSGTGVPTVTQAGTGGYTSSTTGKRTTSWSVRATLKIYRDKPEAPGETIYEASRVLDQYHALQSSSSSSGVRSGVKTRS